MGLLHAVVTIRENASAVMIQFLYCHLGFVKQLLKAFFFQLLLVCKLSHPEKQNPDPRLLSEEEEEESHPSPAAMASLVHFPVPVESVTAAAIKQKLSVEEYDRVAERLKKENEDDEEEEEEARCAVCLEEFEGKQEVRELSNCRHVYHRHCLDAWVDKGHATCPLCRAKLWSADDGVGAEEPRDPWRLERMMYLFGEDVLF